MSRNSDPSIPPFLRDRLQAEDAEERDDLEAVWHLLEAADRASEEAPDLDAEWEALRRRRFGTGGATDPAVSPAATNGQAAPDRSRRARRSALSRRVPRWSRWGMALAVVLVVAVGALWAWRQPVTVAVGPGQQKTTTLPDGSTVELNSGTTLSYRRAFQVWPFVEAERRAVQVEGEAFFAVDRETRPFVVETANARVTVEGTRFNVRARSAAEQSTEVTVADGRIRVAARHRPEETVLLDGRGQTSRVEGERAAPTTPKATEVDPVLAWRHEGFAVREEPLSRVVHELERRYDTTIRLHDSLNRTNARVSLYYPETTPLSTILRDLCTALDLNYRPTNRGYEIFAGPNEG